MSQKWSEQPPKSSAAGPDVFLLIDSDVDPTVSKRITFAQISDSLQSTTQTFTNKTFALGGTGNSLSGTVTEFNTALTSDTFAFIGVENNFSERQFITLPLISIATGLSIGNSEGNLVFGNNTANALEFAPTIILSLKGSGNPSLIQLEVPATSDTGTEPVFILNMERTGGTNIVARPLWELRNNSVKQASVAADGTWDFGTNSLTSGTWNGSTVLVPRGGTGAITFTQNGVIVGNSGNNLQAISPGTAGQVLTSRGAAQTPIFVGPVLAKFTDVITANMTVSEGNAFSDVIVLDTQGSQVSGFVMPESVDSKVNFKVTVPFDLSTTALNARIRTHFITVEDNTGTTVKMLLNTKATATGEVVNTAFVGGETKDFTVSTSKLVLSTQDQTISSTLAAGDLITGQLFRSGTSGDDTAKNILITKINLVIDRVPFG